MAPRRFESDAVDVTPLAQPLHFPFSSKTAPNRFLKSAMTERLSSWDPVDLPKRGVPSQELINVYRHWGAGGTGLHVSGNIMIEYDHLEAAGNPIIPRDAEFSGPRFEAFKEMAIAAKKHGALFIGQVSHPGRQVEDRIQKNPISASDLQVTGVQGMSFAKPHAATQEEINNIIEGFAHAAEYLEKAGYDGIQLHGAHGYLLAQFLSQRTNLRTDAYGGDLTNRSRIVTEIAAAIRARVSPSFILSIKMNSVEWQDKGINPEEARELVKILEANRFDFVELSGGTYESNGFVHKKESTRKREAFFLEFADAIVPELKQTKAYVTGGFRTVAAMVDALKTVDGIGLARPLCAEPRLVNDILSGKVTGAIVPAVDEKEIMLTVVLAGTQIRQLSKDQQPLDSSDEKAIGAFMKDLGAFMQAMGADTNMKRHGFVDLVSLDAVPYAPEDVATA
ncbi:NADH oxidase [Corynespora cassiicola Philippines]|uniref:NADH oxidase n=1 Tax=Corynespora cassiicola Philippines TaxID=1448308 RepID=A0A2T2ND23_CORCC|nr:NADH oxidase [Corynespora cassiicola Philippines]